MNITSLDRKTVRPGNLADFSYYRSAVDKFPETKSVSKKNKSRRTTRYLLIVFAVLLIPLGFSLNSKAASNKLLSSSKPPVSNSVVAPAVSSTNYCANNSISQKIIVSISARHLWACSMNKELYNSAVITGISLHPDTVTPTGTYTIYAKETDTTLTGSDSTGSWSDPVNYWMPFLNNQYGTYGLHDATWRSNSDFGNISPNSSNASQGCVEMPLATAQWIYNWANVGTTVTITS